MSGFSQSFMDKSSSPVAERGESLLDVLSFWFMCVNGGGEMDLLDLEMKGVLNLVFCISSVGDTRRRKVMR